MMSRRGVLGMLAGGAAALLSGCNLFGGSAYRYRLTVEVQTAKGVRTGSGVREVSMTENFVLTAHESPYSGGETGEAVVVDLPSGPVFLLLRGADAMGQQQLVLRPRRLAAEAIDVARSGGLVQSGEELLGPQRQRAAAEADRAGIQPAAARLSLGGRPRAYRADDMKEFERADDLDPG